MRLFGEKTITLYIYNFLMHILIGVTIDCQYDKLSNWKGFSFLTNHAFETNIDQNNLKI